jgi:hypothetical protein
MARHAVAIVLLLGAARASGLEDACRAGASSLDDRRALAALRAVPFLERYLAGREEAEPFFSAPPAGATVSQAR